VPACAKRYIVTSAIVLTTIDSRLGGVVVSVLSIGPKDCGFEPGKRDGIFKDDKNPQHTFLSDGK
jgi:hypothetical protein